MKSLKVDSLAQGIGDMVPALQSMAPLAALAGAILFAALVATAYTRGN